jgi:serine/threonine protein kinase
MDLETAARVDHTDSDKTGQPCDLPPRYQLRKTLPGAWLDGTYTSGLDLLKGYKVAIFNMVDVYAEDHNVFCEERYVRPKRLIRHLKLLRHFRSHGNISRIQDVYSTDASYECIHIITSHMDTDLRRVITSAQPLSDDHVRYFIYQILRGLKFVHGAGVVHRDLRPSNIILNANCDLKISGFGLAGSPDRRSIPIMDQFSRKDVAFLEDNIRCYHAPELLLGAEKCFKATDMWSVGCILAELLGRKSIFPNGKDYCDMVRMVLSVTGTPAAEDCTFLGERAIRFVSNMEERQPQSLSALLPAAHHEAVDLLSKLLVFDPRKRLMVRQALEHPYFQELHDHEDEPICDRAFDFDFESALTSKDECHEVVRRECEYYSVRWRYERAYVSLLLHSAQSACICACRSLKSHVLLQAARVHAQKAAVASNMTLLLRRAQRLQLLSASSLFGRLVLALTSPDVPMDMGHIPPGGLMSRVARLLLIRNTFFVELP